MADMGLRGSLGADGAAVLPVAAEPDRSLADRDRGGSVSDVTGVTDAGRVRVARWGVWVAPLVAGFGAASLLVAISTPPRSGPFCSGDCMGYPYTDVAAFVPRDYWWMYPTVVLALLFVVLAVCLHEWAGPDSKLPAAVAVCFTTIGATVIAGDYGIQLTVLQPGLLTGQTEGLSALSQYNPHGVFIAMENVGYAAFGVAFLFLGGALAAAASRLERVVRWVFTVGGALIVAALVISALVYRAALDYRFEVISLSITWLVLITAGVLLTFVFSGFRAGAARAPR
jgi:hypothetical protein